MDNYAYISGNSYVSQENYNRPHRVGNTVSTDLCNDCLREKGSRVFYKHKLKCLKHTREPYSGPKPNHLIFGVTYYESLSFQEKEEIMKIAGPFVEEYIRNLIREKKQPQQQQQPQQPQQLQQPQQPQQPQQSAKKCKFFGLFFK